MSEDPGIIADDERALLTQAAEWPHYHLWTELTQPCLAQIAAEHGLDFATILLYERLRRSDRHGPFIRRIEELMTYPPHEPHHEDVLLAVAPGMFYRELPGTGADGRLLRQRAAAHGYRTALIPTNSSGTVVENGRIICDWLAEHRQERIVLASVSKGGGDIKAALREPDAATVFRPVTAWLNCCGLTQGSPLANWVHERKLTKLFYKAVFWWKGLDFALTWEMRWGRGAPLDFALELPAHIRLIHVVGFPLQQHLTSDKVRRCQRNLAPLGPNDGTILLADACALPGLVYPVWGADHNLRPAWDIRRLVAALTFYLAETPNRWPSPNDEGLPLRNGR